MATLNSGSQQTQQPPPPTQAIQDNLRMFYFKVILFVLYVGFSIASWVLLHKSKWFHNSKSSWFHKIGFSKDWKSFGVGASVVIGLVWPFLYGCCFRLLRWMETRFINWKTKGLPLVRIIFNSAIPVGSVLMGHQVDQRDIHGLLAVSFMVLSLLALTILMGNPLDFVMVDSLIAILMGNPLDFVMVDSLIAVALGAMVIFRNWWEGGVAICVVAAIVRELEPYLTKYLENNEIPPLPASPTPLLTAPPLPPSPAPLKRFESSCPICSQH